MRAASWVVALAAILALSLGASVGADSVDSGAVNEAPAPRPSIGRS